MSKYSQTFMCDHQSFPSQSLMRPPDTWSDLCTCTKLLRVWEDLLETTLIYIYCNLNIASTHSLQEVRMGTGFTRLLVNNHKFFVFWEVDYEGSTACKTIYYIHFEITGGHCSVINSRESHLLKIASFLFRIKSAWDVKAFPIPLFNNPVSESIKCWDWIGTEFCDFKIAVIKW